MRWRKPDAAPNLTIEGGEYYSAAKPDQHELGKTTQHQGRPDEEWDVEIAGAQKLGNGKDSKQEHDEVQKANRLAREPCKKRK